MVKIKREQNIEPIRVSMTADGLRQDIVTHQYSSAVVFSASFWVAHVFVPCPRRQNQDSRMPLSYGVPTSVNPSGQVGARTEDNCSWNYRLSSSDGVVTSWTVVGKDAVAVSMVARFVSRK